jgi:hypothetical protein
VIKVKTPAGATLGYILLHSNPGTPASSGYKSEAGRRPDTTDQFQESYLGTGTTLLIASGGTRFGDFNSRTPRFAFVAWLWRTGKPLGSRIVSRSAGLLVFRSSLDQNQ